MTKYHRLWGLNNRNLFSYSSGGWKAKIKMPAGLVYGENPVLGVQMVTFSLCPHREKGGRQGSGRERGRKREKETERQSSRSGVPSYEDTNPI